MIRPKKIVQLALIGCLLYVGFQKNRYDLVSRIEILEVRKKLKQLPLQDRKDLAYFIEYTTVFCQYPYTLIGYKPMSICNYLQNSADLPEIFQLDYQRPKSRNFSDKLERGFCVWKKHHHLFASNNFLIVPYHSSVSSGMREIALIHKPLCLRQITDHSDAFSSQLSCATTALQTFDILSNPSHQYFYDVVENDLLLGILLGFGRENAELFHTKQRDQLMLFSDEWSTWPRKWFLPGFCCDHSTEETRMLKSHYIKARKHIRWTYFNRDNLEVTLALLEKH